MFSHDIPSAKIMGFDDDVIIRDRSQMLLLRALYHEIGPKRLYLKGGMAMRALYGSIRLTKDIDFERAENLPVETAGKRLAAALMTAAKQSRLSDIVLNDKKSTKTSTCWRLEGKTGRGLVVSFEVQISGRGLPTGHLLTTTLRCPSDYSITPFVVEAYDQDAMAAAKIAAVMSANRDAPRDVFDLNDLLSQNANPVALLAQRLSVGQLETMRANIFAKIEAISWNHAESELMPYIAPVERERYTRARWNDMCLTIASGVEAWLQQAQDAKQASGGG